LYKNIYISVLTKGEFKYRFPHGLKVKKKKTLNKNPKDYGLSKHKFRRKNFKFIENENQF